MKNIKIYHAFPSAKSETADPSKSEVSISFQDLKAWVYSGKILFHLFRYREVRLVSYDLKLMARPFLSALLIWCMGRKAVFREDLKGAKEKIDLAFLAKAAKSIFFTFFTKLTLLKRAEVELKWLDTMLSMRSAPSLDLQEKPLYLRTDFCFGLQAGGSVGHIAGVLNNLGHFFKDPIFMTSDVIPTVNSNIDTHVIQPEHGYWDFWEVWPLDYSRFLFKRAMQLLGPNKPAFIYQRYSLNQYGGASLAQHLKVPFILEFNGSEVWINRNWGHSLKYENLAAKIEMFNLHAADLIVVVSKPLKTALISKNIDPNKILVNPNGVDPEKYHPDIDASQIRLQLKLEDFLVIGFIGTFGAWHGTEVLAESFCRLLHQFPEYRSKVRLLMIGHGDRMPLVQKIIAKWNLAEACVFTGIIPQKEGPQYLAACDVFVSPQIPNSDNSPFFGSPTKIFEYMAMGKGIVASNLDQIGEVLEHGRTAFLVEPGSVESLMQGLKTLIDHPELRKKLGQEAREEVVKNYSWKEHTRKIAEKILSMQQSREGI